MEISPEQYERIAPYLPIQWGNVIIPNLPAPNAILYVAAHGCKRRGLPERFGNRHAVYTRMNRGINREQVNRHRTCGRAFSVRHNLQHLVYGPF